MRTKQQVVKCCPPAYAVMTEKIGMKEICEILRKSLDILPLRNYIYSEQMFIT